MPDLDFQDIQGLVRRGYGDMQAASYLLLHVRDGAAARRWLGQTYPDITDADSKPANGRTNIAFTYQGLARLGLPDSQLRDFSAEFRSGMTSPERSRILGDTGNSAPEHWIWGNSTQRELHACLLVFAANGSALNERLQHYRRGFDAAGLEEVHELSTQQLDRREHFGFRDGIGQPAIEGMHHSTQPSNTIAPGEILLGHPGQNGRPGPGPREFGRNGTYVVLRQLRQFVHTFWRYVDQQAHSLGGNPDERRIKLASKMVGRWPSGAAITKHPQDDPWAGAATSPTSAELNDFAYLDDDPHGERCPIGAHVRRCNPRDSLAPGPVRSIRNSKIHRILRRGRPYGAAVTPSMAPGDILATPEDGVDRGLQFLCLNADLAHQFEFVQQNWVNSTKFEGRLYDETDPIAGPRKPGEGQLADQFTVQDQPVRLRFSQLPEFIQVRGGAYWFMPGMAALRSLADLEA